MTAITVPPAHRRRQHNKISALFMTGEPRHQRRGRGGKRGMHGQSGFGGPSFGGRKAPRGEIRAAILALLDEEPMHGYQIIRELSERTGGVWQPSPGSVYPTLQQLEDEDLVQAEQSASGKRVFHLTDAGRETATALPSKTPWEDVGSEANDTLVALRDLAFQVMAATRQVAQAGTTAQIAAAQDVLRTARKGLYRLLAEDDATDGPNQAD
jgi:DNA-binding PadR family transcriptional regulator